MYVHMRCHHPVAIMCPFFTVKRFLFEFKIGWRQEEQQVFLSDSEMVYWSNWKSNMWIHSSMPCYVHIQFVFFWLLLISSKEVLHCGVGLCSQFFYSSLLYSYFLSSPVDRRHISLSSSSRYEHSMSSITDFLCCFYVSYGKVRTFVQF